MTRRRFVLALAFLLVLFAFGAWLFYLPEKVTRANFDKIDVGMSLDDVQDLLRRPNEVWRMKGLVSKGGDAFISNDGLEVRQRDGHRDYLLRQWNSPEITIVVVFDETNRVAARYSAQPQEEPWYLRLINAVGRKIR